jgi:hypothetical protein
LIHPAQGERGARARRSKNQKAVREPKPKESGRSIAAFFSASFNAVLKIAVTKKIT